MPAKSPETETFWQAFRRHTGHEGDYEVVAFGDRPEMATELADLVLAGTKRATASLAREFADRGEKLPAVGDHVVVVDGEGAPRCIWRTTEIVVKPLDEVDEAFAWDEGEGDRTRQWWLDGHREYFARQAARNRHAFHDRIETVFERFTLVWPLPIAGRLP